MFEQLFFPVTLILTGILVKNKKEINSWIGYRTVSSMKNITNWRYAQRTSGNLFMRIGAIILVINLITLWIYPTFTHTNTVDMLLFLIGIVHLFITVERGLKKLNKEAKEVSENE